MQASEPFEVYDLFGRYFSARAIDLLMTLYEDDAIMLPSAGRVAKGKEAIRGSLNGFLAIDGMFSMEKPTVIESGDIALLMAKWKLEGKSPDGNDVNIAGHTSDVVRRQADDSWLFVIDNPFGTAAAGGIGFRISARPCVLAAKIVKYLFALEARRRQNVCGPFPAERR